MINALTVDVEDYFHVAAFAENISAKDWSRFQLRVEANTQRILELFARNNTRATFFTLGWVAEKVPELVAEIARQGHEVACHGYSHRLIYKQDPQVFYDETRRAKDILEAIINQPVYGYRAASYSITKQSLWALDTLAELGFEYDSSIVPVHHDLYGIPDMPRQPHVLNTPNGHEMIEFPPSTLSLPGMNLPIAGGGYFRLYPYWFTRAGLKWVNRHDRMPFIFYLHPWEVDPEQPRMQGKWFSRFRHYNNLDKCYGRLEKLLNEFEFSTVRHVLSGQQLISDQFSAGKPAIKVS